MIINLSPCRMDGTLEVSKAGDTLTINGEQFNFSRMSDGDTLPVGAFSCIWIAGDVDKQNGELTLNLLLPLPQNYSQAQAFPVPLVNVTDGAVVLPEPLPSDEPPSEQVPWPAREGVIDWGKLITLAQKDAQAAAARLAAARAELATRNSSAVVQIDRIADRVATLGYGMEAGEATPEDEAEHAALTLSLKAWKAYKFALGKVTTKEGWFESPAWPIEPATPEIIAAPMLAAEETV